MEIEGFEEWQRRERELLQEGEKLLREIERSERESERREHSLAEEKALRSRLSGGQRICKVIR